MSFKVTPNQKLTEQGEKIYGYTKVGTAITDPHFAALMAENDPNEWRHLAQDHQPKNPRPRPAYLAEVAEKIQAEKIRRRPSKPYERRRADYLSRAGRAA